MAILSVQNLGKYFGGQDIFTGLNLVIEHGDRIALIGPNGEGKTTLLRIIARKELATDGQIFTAKEVKIGYLEQHASLISTHGTLWQLALGAFANLLQAEAELRALEQALAAETDEARHADLLHQYGEAQLRFELDGGYDYELTINQVLTGLGFTAADYQRPLAQFSGGEQSRAQLARILLEKPNLLLLDEPTNHLDLASVEWLENYLQSWPGAVLVVAHDRYFLDKVATRVWELSFGRVETYRGNFSQYVTQRAERLERQQKEYEAQQAFIAKEEDFIRRNIAGQRTKEAQGRRKRLERLEEFDRPIEHKTLKLGLQTTLRSGDLVLATHNLAVGYPDGDVLFNCPDLEIRRGNTIALLGPNGAGKTTFLKTILGQLAPKAGEIRFGAGVIVGYFAQTHSSLNLSASILDEILSVRNLPVGEARNYLGRFLFSGDDVFKPVGTLSGGERSRVALAKLTLTGSNFLILDEPTNHLDIASQENLEAVLNEFAGTILLVSHDRYFVDALADHVWALEPDTKSVTITEGGYSTYLGLQQQSSPAATPSNGNVAEDSPKGKRIREQNKAEKRAIEKKAREIAEIEATIAATEQRLAELSAQLEAASLAQDIAKLQELSQVYQSTEAKLEELITQWTELEAA
ncbi:MAG: Energy-dependent translational throttle protein EttA [Anaerolineae bacterium]|nr:Energy-dependent translational throttle protein EttA [Anaerolineae bacterium]